MPLRARTAFQAVPAPRPVRLPGIIWPYGPKPIFAPFDVGPPSGGLVFHNSIFNKQLRPDGIFTPFDSPRARYAAACDGLAITDLRSTCNQMRPSSTSSGILMLKH
jgi:hypothetical protein